MQTWIPGFQQGGDPPNFPWRVSWLRLPRHTKQQRKASCTHL